MADRVFRDKETGAWRCIVNGTVHGDWESRALAKAGMRVEQQRVQRRGVEAIAKARGGPRDEPGFRYGDELIRFKDERSR